MTDSRPGTRFRFSLRQRLFLGLLAVTLVATAGFAVALYEFVEVLEDELLHQTLVRDLDALVIDYRDDADIAGQRGDGDRVYVTTSEDDAALPDALHAIDPGRYRVIQHAGREYYAGRRDIGTAHIYLMLSVASVEGLETRLATIGWLTFTAAIIVAFLIAMLCARLILNPVRSLAERVATLQPGEPNPPLAADYSDETIKAIAHSFDALVERFHAFVQREQAFTQDASHELRTPLAVMLSTTELLLTDSDTSARTHERAERIYASGLRMQRLVAALLFLARGEPRQHDDCDVAAVFDDVLPSYQAAIRHKQLTLNVDTRHSPVEAPAGMVDCVLHNLLENAVEYTDSGHIDVYIAPTCIRVSDSGCGITPEALQDIFSHRYHSRDNRRLGIGLYLVQRICARLDWQLDVHSTPGAGTYFEITLTSTQHKSSLDTASLDTAT